MVTLAGSFRNRFVRSRAIASLFLCGLLLVSEGGAAGFETDQYNLPPWPLADIGDAVTDHVEQKLRQAVGRLTSKSRPTKVFADKHHLVQAQRLRFGDKEQARIAYLRSNDAVASKVYQLLALEFPLHQRRHVDGLASFPRTPARYRTSFFQSIFLPWPSDTVTVSPTVKLYGSHFGTDKIAHLFQQDTLPQDLHAGTGRGRPGRSNAERCSLGTGNGTGNLWNTDRHVYSNGDLAANYVGKFYQGLTQAVKIELIPGQRCYC
jgi:hypothetical protein